jgi:hypothetical protein
LCRFKDSNAEISRQVAKLLDQFRSQEPQRPNRFDTSLVELWRILLAHHSSVREEHADRLLDDLESLQTSDSQPNMKGVIGQLARAMRRLRGKTIFEVQGLIGISVTDVESGDLVILPYQVSRPVILRPSTAGSEDRFLLVGFAYIQGIMRDESANLSLASELLATESRTYVIH